MHFSKNKPVSNTTKSGETYIRPTDMDGWYQLGKKSLYKRRFFLRIMFIHNLKTGMKIVNKKGG